MADRGRLRGFAWGELGEESKDTLAVRGVCGGDFGSSRGGLPTHATRRGVRETGGCLFLQPAQALAPARTPVSEKVYESTVNRALLFPFSVTLRRSHDACINQRIDSLPCPALFSMFPGRLARGPRDEPPSSTGTDLPNHDDRPAQARTTVGLCAGGRRSGESLICYVIQYGAD